MNDETQKSGANDELIDITLKKLDVIERHLKNVREACDIIGRKMIMAGQIEFGVKLIANSYLHDNNKFAPFEFNYLINNDDKDTLKMAIFEHQTSNPHHPAYWGGIEHCPRIVLGEIVADLYARAIEFGTDLRGYIKEVYCEKHGLSTHCKTYKTIKEFVDLLLEVPFKQL